MQIYTTSSNTQTDRIRIGISIGNNFVNNNNTLENAVKTPPNRCFIHDEAK